MNRHQRRATGANKTKNETCVGCACSVILTSMLENCDKMIGLEGVSAIYRTDEELITNFGILSVHISKTKRVRVISHGREVFAMTPERVEKEERGPWVDMLAAIACDLMAAFGEPGGEPRHLH